MDKCVWVYYNTYKNHIKGQTVDIYIAECGGKLVEMSRNEILAECENCHKPIEIKEGEIE